MARVGAGTVAIVTGASSGIGWATALELARRGAWVVAVARREERLRELARACEALGGGGSCEPRAGDLGERGFAEAVVEETAARCGRLDVLVNNAAMPKHRHALHTSADDAERVMRVNYLSAVWTTYAALPVLLRQEEGGVVVNVSSFAATVVPPREGLYAASKAAMNAFTEGLWNDLEGSRVHVGLVVPGAIDTEIWEKQEEPNAFAGRRHPPRVVVKAILRVIEERRHELVAPARDPGLVSARVLRQIAPGMVRRGVARMDPVPRGVFDAAVERARRGLRLGEED